MDRKRILHLTQATGGVKTYVAHILEFADHDSFEFVIMAPENHFFEEFCSERSVRYYPVDLHRGNNPFKNISTLIKIISIIKKENPDIIHAHSAKGGFLGRLAAKITNKKVLYTPHAFSYLPFTGISRMIFYLLELISKNWTSKLLAISYSEANRARHELGYGRNQVKVILNSIPINDHTGEHIERGNLKIRMIGRLTQQKNHLLFLEVANGLLVKYPDLQFAIFRCGHS